MSIEKNAWKQDAPASQQTRYPRAVFFIIGNEFCERFSYYGMRTILTIYLTQMLLYDDNSATMIFHVFAMACYFTPLLGAFIADSWLGKFKTIFYISIIYAIGNVVISVGSIPQELQSMKILSLIGLGLIALGTGGIKPCVSAFGGDQFEPGQEEYLQKFFSFFYLAINLGSTFSTFITPILRDDVQCFDSLKCFPLAFGVPAILMIVSLILFLLGKPLYKIRPPEGNIVARVTKCIGHAIVQKFQSGKKRDHWLDYADDEYEKQFITDIKTVLHVLCLYLPLPIFWALFDQQGSRWTLQATRMDGRFYGYVIRPDQMQFFNPFLVILLIPLFEYCIYPLFKKCNFLVKPLQRITVGGLLAAAAFVIAGFIQLKIEETYPVIPESDFSATLVINNSPCTLNINETSYIPPFSSKKWDKISLGEQRMLNLIGCNSIEEEELYNFTSIYPIQSMMITESGDKLKVIQVEDTRDKNEVGQTDIRFYFNLKPNPSRQKDFIKLIHADNTFTFSSSVISSDEDSVVGVTDYEGLPMGKYKVYLDSGEEDAILVDEVTLEPGGRYIGVIFQNRTGESKIQLKNLITVVNPNSVHILFLVPQYVIITVGEIMFSITGLEFSYSQAPASMKSVLQAAWLLTVAFGNLIVVIVAEAKLFEQQSIEFFMFATLMGVDMLIFAAIAVFYKYVDNQATPEEATESKNGLGKNNPAYEEDTHF